MARHSHSHKGLPSCVGQLTLTWIARSCLLHLGLELGTIERSACCMNTETCASALLNKVPDGGGVAQCKGVREAPMPPYFLR